MSDKALLDILGYKLMYAVRDPSINRFDCILSGDVKAKSLIALHKSLRIFDSEQSEIIREIVVESIDEAIYNFLDMLEQNEETMKLFISQYGNNGKNVVEISDGLSGELFTEDGWKAKFSQHK